MKQDIFFTDLDGTLEDSRTDMIGAIQRLRSEYGLNLRAHKEQRELVNKGMDFLYRNAFPEIFAGTNKGSEQDILRLQEVQSDYTREYSAHIADHTVLYAGIYALLHKLKDNVYLICYTNKPESLSQLLLEKLGVLECFDCIIGGDSYPEAKPSPEPMKRLARKLGFDAGRGRAYYMGDTTGDMRAAHNFGAQALWCTWGYQAQIPVDPRPDLQINMPGEIYKLLHI